ncbi:UNVERIFIED_CONTAM: hypothetical protein K2H54_056621 [Gekko kuhli]
MVWVTTELPKRGQSNTSFFKKTFGQYKYFTYKMASNYIYKGGREETFQGWFMRMKRKDSSFAAIKELSHMHARTHIDTEEKFGPEYFFLKVQHRFELRLNPLKS